MHRRGGVGRHELGKALGAESALEQQTQRLTADNLTRLQECLSPPRRASKMAITRASRVKARGTSAHRIRNFMLFDLVRGQVLPKMHVAPGNRDLLPFSPPPPPAGLAGSRHLATREPSTLYPAR